MLENSLLSFNNSCNCEIWKIRTLFIHIIKENILKLFVIMININMGTICSPTDYQRSTPTIDLLIIWSLAQKRWLFDIHFLCLFSIKKIQVSKKAWGVKVPNKLRLYLLVNLSEITTLSRNQNSKYTDTKAISTIWIIFFWNVMSTRLHRTECGRLLLLVYNM